MFTRNALRLQMLPGQGFLIIKKNSDLFFKFHSRLLFKSVKKIWKQSISMSRGKPEFNLSEILAFSVKSF